MIAQELVQALEGNLDGELVVEVPLEKGKLMCELMEIRVRKRETEFGEAVTTIYLRTEKS